MAKRKRRPGGGPKLRQIKDYRDDEYTPYIFRAETGILQAWTMEPDLRDGDVRQGLRDLIKRSGELSEIVSQDSEAVKEASKDFLSKSTQPLMQWLVINNLRDAFQEHGPLSAEDLAGIMKVINNSVGAWNRGMRGQEYLRYIKGFLGNVGVNMRRLTPEEAEQLGLTAPENVIEGEYDEIE